MFPQSFKTICDPETPEYQLVFSKRKTVSIQVYPNQTVVVKAPHHVQLEKIHEFVKKRISWIQKKLYYFSQHPPHQIKKQYVEGEHHFYLGKSYPIKLKPGGANQVILEEEALHITCKTEPHIHFIKKNLEAWYIQQAKNLFVKLMDGCWAKLNHLEHRKPLLRVRKMKTRWGTFSSKTFIVTLNSELIKSPVECIEYVIMHEFCHVWHRNHGKDFYARLENILPDWHQRRKTLNTFGI